ncbi:Nicalin [Rhynchospora pubera]|uniref:Nicalin n=1 Tax=Rhynchospora pubera TaxID=906938 RepID=A0AAV8F0J6_9POAL|nr:Nicalin [Rhynchospora pubera]
MAAPATTEAFSLSYSMFSLLLILFACVELGDAASAVHVYRLIQYDLGGVPLGSRISHLNHHAASLPLDPNADLSRSALLVPLLDLDLSFLTDYITNKKPLGGLVILLPQKLGNKFADFGKHVDLTRVKSVLNQLEDLLVHAELPYPVYFAYESSTFDSLLGDIRGKNFSSQPATSTNGGYKLVISTPEAKKLSPPTISNFQGWLPGQKDGDSEQLPTIAIVASYDTFGAAPALSVGSDSNGSGVAALLEIARLFSRLYSNPKTRGKYNLLFGLTSGGPYNYNGTQKWLRSFDQRVRESIDYAICLNSVGSWENDLWMHVSKPPENVYIKEIYDGFSEVAQDMGFSINVKHKKINISNSRVAWEHEQFSRFRVTALTLSGLSAAPEFLQSTGNLHDTRKSADEKAVARTVKLVAESLARQIYGHKGKKIDIFADGSSLAVNVHHIQSWLDLISQTPRVAPFLSKNNPFIAALKKELSDHTVDVHVQNEVLDGTFTFYDSTEATLNIYQVAGVTFDFLFLMVLGSYLIVLFSFLVITTRGLDDLINIFRRPAVRKSKST